MVSTVSGSFFTRSHTNEASSIQSRIVRGIGLKAFVDGRQAQKNPPQWAGVQDSKR